MAKKKKETFEIEIDGKPVKLAVNRPTHQQEMEAQKVFNKVFKDCLESDCIVRGSIRRLLVKQGVWSDEIEKERNDTLKFITDNSVKLTDDLDPSVGRSLAEEIKAKRNKLRELTTEWNSMDANTAEYQADNHRFNKLVSLCTVYDDTGKPVFSSYDDFMERADEPVAMQAATKLMYLVYNLEGNAEDSLPENKYLAKLDAQQPSVLNQQEPNPSPADAVPENTAQ